MVCTGRLRTRRRKAPKGAIRDGIADLALFPLIGAKGGVRGTRERVVRQHRVVYRVSEADKTVLAIFGPGQSSHGPS
jgi:plasmid stabilization system protein ParE